MLYRKWFYCLFTTLMVFGIEAQQNALLKVENYDHFEAFLYAVDEVRLDAPEVAIRSLDEAYEYYITNQDTLNAVNALVELAVISGHQALYQDAYDNLWKGLILADAASNEISKIPVYQQLGRYYSFYKRKEKALDYLLMALELAKKFYEKEQYRKESLAECYYLVATTYRELDNFEKSSTYLDSCYQYSSSENGDNNDYYFKTEEAILLTNKGEVDRALDTLYKLQSWYKENVPSFQVLLNTYIGDALLKKNDTNGAVESFRKALEISNKYQSHLDFTPTIYNRLADIYLKQENFELAFYALQNERNLDAAYFDSRSPSNASLLEIKDEFVVEKEKRDKIINEQRLQQLESEKKVKNLQAIIFLLVTVFVGFGSYIYVQYLRKKFKIEKALIRKKRELEVKQANELIELKNKELATSSLKLIEKDELLSTLKERLSSGQGDIKAAELKKIVRSISHSNGHNWEEFETRFLSVNKDFYDRLNRSFPKLSRGDQKLCALVKLNLSSKEMAKLLGISIESVHTNRYRLRKKLGLTRDISLTEFIAKL